MHRRQLPRWAEITIKVTMVILALMLPILPISWLVTYGSWWNAAQEQSQTLSIGLGVVVWTVTTLVIGKRSRRKH